jgi:hypothetical protein
MYTVSSGSPSLWDHGPVFFSLYKTRARCNLCQYPVPGGGPAVQKRCFWLTLYLYNISVRAIYHYTYIGYTSLRYIWRYSTGAGLWSALRFNVLTPVWAAVGYFDDPKPEHSLVQAFFVPYACSPLSSCPYVRTIVLLHAFRRSSA